MASLPNTGTRAELGRILQQYDRPLGFDNIDALLQAIPNALVNGRGGRIQHNVFYNLWLDEADRLQPQYLQLRHAETIRRNDQRRMLQIQLLNWVIDRDGDFYHCYADGTCRLMTDRERYKKAGQVLRQRRPGRRMRRRHQAHQAFNVTALAQRPVDHGIDPIAQQQQLNPGEWMANMRDGNANVMDLDIVPANADDDDELSVDVIHDNNADDIDQEIADRFGNFGDQLMEERPMEEEAAAAPPLDIIAELDGFRIWDGMEDIVDHLYDRYHGLALVPMPWLEDGDDVE